MFTGVSLGAINENNELVGVSINNINYRRESISGPPEAGDEECTHPKFKVLYNQTVRINRPSQHKQV
ncbi:hypothetical protein WDU94_003487 [Cyamophila willieti]